MHLNPKLKQDLLRRNMEESAASIDRKMHESSGADFFNKFHRRAYSVNILIQNSEELLSTLSYLADPEHGMRLMSQGHREAGLHSHREVARHMHNFVSSALSLVDHTRVLMQEYSGTSVEADFNVYKERNFKFDPLTKFVQGLRNYMLHRSLPPTEMFLEIKRADADSHTIASGVRLSADELRDWKGWTAPAKQYLEQAGAYVEIDVFVSQYVQNASKFEKWLRERLEAYHRDDLDEFEELSLKHDDLVMQSALSRTGSEVASKGKWTQAGDELINAADVQGIAERLQKFIGELELAPRSPEAFPSQRPVHLRLTPGQMIGEPTFVLPDKRGAPVMVLLTKDEVSKGLNSSGMELLSEASNSLLKNGWIQTKIGADRVREVVIDWCRKHAGGEAVSGLCEFARVEFAKGIKDVTCLFPVDNFEIESSFDLGPAALGPLSADFFDKLVERSLAAPAAQRNDIDALFSRMRDKYQGLAAVKFQAEADPQKAQNDGKILAEQVVAILRFFSPAASDASQVVIIGLSGAIAVPMNSCVSLFEDGFSFTEGVALKNTAGWKLSAAQASKKMAAIRAAVSAARVEDKSFASAVSAALQSFGNASTISASPNRLDASLSALEAVFIRHESEQPALRIPRRTALLLGQDAGSQKQIENIMRQSYAYKRTGLSDQMEIHREFMQDFVRIGHQLLMTCLANLENFSAKSAFIDAIEARGA